MKKLLPTVIVLVILVSIGVWRISPSLFARDINRSEGLFPHEVGNYWVKDKYDSCTGSYKMEVIQSFSTDTADFFQIRHFIAPCEGEKEVIYTRWYAEDIHKRVYYATDQFKYMCLYTDFNRKAGDRFLRLGLMDYVVEKSENRIVHEYDDYETGKANSTTFELGLGPNPLSWSSVRINNVIYTRGTDY